MAHESERFKVVLIGDAEVGKTSLLRRLISGDFQTKLENTVGANHYQYRVHAHGEDIDLAIWDTAGQEQFSSLVPFYSRGAQACILVVSVVDLESCRNATVWKQRLSESTVLPPIIVAINKTDLCDDSGPSDSVLATLGSWERQVLVSAKSGIGIEDLFEKAAVLAAASRVQIGIDPAIATGAGSGSGCDC
jgi:small GTP-binding protein